MESGLNIYRIFILNFSMIYHALKVHPYDECQETFHYSFLINASKKEMLCGGIALPPQ